MYKERGWDLDNRLLLGSATDTLQCKLSSESPTYSYLLFSQILIKQISVEELQTALSFLREQVGEEELRHMLEVLSREASEDGKIDVNKLMDLARHDDNQ